MKLIDHLRTVGPLPFDDQMQDQSDTDQAEAELDEMVGNFTNKQVRALSDAMGWATLEPRLVRRMPEDSIRCLVVLAANGLSRALDRIHKRVLEEP